MHKFDSGVKIQEYVNIKDYSTLQIGGQFRYFTKIENKEDLNSVFSIINNDSRYNNIPIFILGGGSNIVFSNEVLNIFVLKMEIKGFEITQETDEYVDIKVGSGEIWDEVVSRTVDMGLSGFESLSAIPGTVGASPVQNIGAYGVEVKDTILEVEVLNIKENVIEILSNEECKFGYRESIFKSEAKGKYIIIGVTYRLNKSLPTIPKYPGVLKYFEMMEINSPTLQQIRQAIINIRKDKLPNPNEIPNVGSFFKNPIVLNEFALKILVEFPDAKIFKVNETHTKVPAGWLIENAGLKGKSFGTVSVYNKNALVLINNGSATSKDILKTRDEIIKIVKDKFGIILEQEPEIV